MPDEMRWAGNRLDAWMDRVEGKLDKLTADMAAMTTLQSRVEDHQERIYGNGQPGLVKDVDRIKQWRKSLYWLVGILGSATAGDFLSRFIGGSK